MLCYKDVVIEDVMEDVIDYIMLLIECWMLCFCVISAKALANNTQL